MRYRRVMLTIGLTIALAVIVRAAEKPTPEHVKAMKDLIGVVQTMTKPGAYGNFEVAKQSASTAADAYVVVQKFWDARNDKEASALSHAGTKAAGEIAAGAAMSSADGVEKAVTALRATCAPCHKAHRLELPDKSFEIQ